MKSEISKNLFAILKNSCHIGNVRASSLSEAINIYILDSMFDEEVLLDVTFMKKYTAEPAIQGLHF